jgi:hypothetical protein
MCPERAERYRQEGSDGADEEKRPIHPADHIGKKKRAGVSAPALLDDGQTRTVCVMVDAP